MPEPWEKSCANLERSVRVLNDPNGLVRVECLDLTVVCAELRAVKAELARRDIGRKEPEDLVHILNIFGVKDDA